MNITPEELVELASLSQARARRPLSKKELKLLVRLAKPPKAPPPVKPPVDPLARLRTRGAALRSQLARYELTLPRWRGSYLRCGRALVSQIIADIGETYRVGTHAQFEVHSARLSLACLLRDFPNIAMDDTERAWAIEYLAEGQRMRAARELRAATADA